MQILRNVVDSSTCEGQESHFEPNYEYLNQANELILAKLCVHLMAIKKNFIDLFAN